MKIIDFCILCGKTSDEVNMIETEDGCICIECGGEDKDIIIDPSGFDVESFHFIEESENPLDY